MKKLLLILNIFLISLAVNAQDCNPYFNIKQGTVIERASYDSKDKLVNKSVETVIENKKTSNGFRITTTTEASDAKGKSLTKMDVESSCINGVYSTDLSEIIEKMLPADAKEKVKVEADKIIYPKSMKKGDKLPKASMSISAGKLINITYEISNRIVQGKETITTPAGKFECIKITSDINLKFMGNKNFKTVEYIAPNIGVVLQEQYTQKGKLESKSIIQKVVVNTQ